MADQQRDVQQPVLASFYEKVLPLADYLAACLRDFDALRERPETSTFHRLLEDSYVAWNGAHGAPKTCAHDDTSDIDIAWSIKKVQSELLRARASNVLCFGYKLSGGSPENKLSNTSLTEMEEHPDWRTLFSLAGTGAFMHVLRHTSMFVPLVNGSYRQVCGIPIYELDKLPPPSKKRKRSESTANGTLSKPGNPEILLSRSSIFYANLTKTQAASSGLSAHHIVERIHEIYPQTALPEYASDLAAARHLSKYIWSEEYGICVNARTPKQKGVAIEQAISAKGPTDTPKRLRAVLPLLNQLLHNHRHIDYAKLRDRTCPSALQKRQLSDDEKNILLGVIAEDSHIPLTQAEQTADSASACDPDQSLELSRISILARSAPKVAEKASQKEKPRFAEFTIPQYQVIRFVMACLDQLLPPTLLGSAGNMRHLHKWLEIIVTARRFETFSLHQILQGFSQKACPWLDHGKLRKSRPSVTDNLRRQALLAPLLRWILDDLVVDIIRTNFYVTESAALQRKTLYFLQSDWRVICQPLVDKMATALFERLDPTDAMAALEAKDRQLSFSHVRLLPKEKGVRPVVNLSRKPAPKTHQSYSLSINQILQNTFAILTYEKHRRAELVGGAVASVGETYTRLKAYKQRMRGKDGSLPKLYFVKLDVQACFDTIDQDKLLGILECILQQDTYSISRHVSMFINRDRPLRRFAREARSMEEFVNFPDFAFQLAEQLSRSIFVDQVRSKTERREQVLKLLREHVKDNIVKIGSQYYRQEVGIPQGSVLSTLLCNFFYGQLEREELKFLDDPDHLLLRLVDDFLLITTKRDIAERFLRTMLAGHPEYGCFVSADKTLVNFDISINSSQAVRKADPTAGFPWCGFVLDGKTLDVRYDYTRLQSTHLGNNLTVKTYKQPGETFIASLVLPFQLKAHLIYYDTTFNSREVVYLNAYQSFQLLAMRYHAYIKIWKPKMERNIMFFLNAIHRMIWQCWLSIKWQFRQKGASTVVTLDMRPRRDVVIWLGYRAFLLVLSQKPTAYKVILNHLRQIVRSKGSRSMMSQLKVVVDHSSNAELRKIQF